MNAIPNLAGVATSDLVEHIGAGSFKAAYINWSRTLHLLREHAPGWMPELVHAADGGVLHRAPTGGFLLIRFRHVSGAATPEVPQAVMDPRNNAVPWEKITARDVTDTHRRGTCMAAAFTFGLAYELWAKLPLESGYQSELPEQPEPSPPTKVLPTDGAWESMSESQQARLLDIAAVIAEYMQDGDSSGAVEYIAREVLSSEEKIALWTRLDSKTRSALKKAQEGRKAA